MLRVLACRLAAPASSQKPAKCGSVFSATGSIRTIHVSKHVVANSKKPRMRRVGLDGPSIAEKTLVGVTSSTRIDQTGAASPSKEINQVSTSTEMKINIRKVVAPRTKSKTPKFRRPNAVQRAFAESEVDVPALKLSNPNEIPGINENLIHLSAQVGVVGKNNTKNPAVLAVAGQLKLPTFDTVADAIQAKMNFIIVVQPLEQIYLQEIKYPPAPEDTTEAASVDSTGKGKVHEEDDEEYDDEDEEDDNDNDDLEDMDDEVSRGKANKKAGKTNTKPEILRPTVGRKIWCDFLQGSLDFRRRFGENQKSPIIRAIKSGKEKDISKLRVLDATAGLAQDAFIIAGMGAHVTLLERNPIMYSLIASGIHIGYRDEEIAKILDRMTVKHEDSIEFLNKVALEDESKRPDVIYLDPMYPSKKKKSAHTKKGMFVTRRLLGAQKDTAQLIEAACRAARSHVVLKRPNYAPETPGAVRSYNSRSTRFEIFDSAGPSKKDQ